MSRSVQTGHLDKLTCRMWWCSAHAPGWPTREALLSRMRAAYRHRARRR